MYALSFPEPNRLRVGPPASLKNSLRMESPKLSRKETQVLVAAMLIPSASRRTRVKLLSKRWPEPNRTEQCFQTQAPVEEPSPVYSCCSGQSAIVHQGPANLPGSAPQRCPPEHSAEARRRA